MCGQAFDAKSGYRTKTILAMLIRGSDKSPIGVVQVINNNECYVIDEAKLSEAAVQYVRSYLPEAFEEEERLSLAGESKLT